MCGIAGIHRRGDAPMPKLNKLADELLLAIEDRGRHAAGYLAMMDDGKVQMQKLAIPASRFIQERGRIRNSARNVLLHTRWATVGRKEDPRNAHPVAQGTIAAIHNGTIYNATSLFDRYKLPRLAEVDSEIFPALVNHLGWENVEKALSKMHGGAAVALVNTETPEEVVLARLEHYPLVYAVTKHAVVWASTEKAIRAAWYRTYGSDIPVPIHRLEEGQIARVNGKVSVTALPLPKRPKPTRSSAGVRVTTTHHGAVPTRTSQNRVSKAKGKKRARIKNGVPRLETPLFADGPRRVSYGLGYPTFDAGYHDEPPIMMGDADEFYDVLRLDGMGHAEAESYAYGNARLPDWVAAVYDAYIP